MPRKKKPRIRVSEQSLATLRANGLGNLANHLDESGFTSILLIQSDKAAVQAYKTKTGGMVFVHGSRALFNRVDKLRKEPGTGTIAAPPTAFGEGLRARTKSETATIRAAIKRVAPRLSVRLGSGTTATWVDITAPGGGRMTDQERKGLKSIGLDPGLGSSVSIAPKDRPGVAARLTQRTGTGLAGGGDRKRRALAR